MKELFQSCRRQCSDIASHLASIVEMIHRAEECQPEHTALVPVEAAKLLLDLQEFRLNIEELGDWMHERYGPLRTTGQSQWHRVQHNEV